MIIDDPPAGIDPASLVSVPQEKVDGKEDDSKESALEIDDSLSEGVASSAEVAREDIGVVFKIEFINPSYVPKRAIFV